MTGAATADGAGFRPFAHTLDAGNPARRARSADPCRERLPRRRAAQAVMAPDGSLANNGSAAGLVALGGSNTYSEAGLQAMGA